MLVDCQAWSCSCSFDFIVDDVSEIFWAGALELIRSTNDVHTPLHGNRSSGFFFTLILLMANLS
jgi:hypothetical protein